MSKQLNVQPALALLFNKGDKAKRFLEEQLTVTRASKGTRVNRFGLIEEVPENELRLDYDPATGECLGVLIEEGRENLILSSEVFSDWSTDGEVTVTDNNAISPKGTDTAATIQTTTSGGQLGKTLPGFSDSEQVAFSIFVEKSPTNSYGICLLRFYGGSIITSVFQFNRKNGNYVEADGFTSSFVNADSIEIVDFGNFWRIKVVMTNNSTGNTDLIINLFPHRGNSFGDYTYIGSSSSFFGTQIERSSRVSSYTPTFGSTVAKSQDDIQIIGSNFNSFFKQGEGTFVISLNEIKDSENTNGIMVVEQANNSGRDFGIMKPPDGSLDGAMNGNYLNIAEENEYTFNDPLKIAFSSNGVNERVYINGNKTFSGTNGIGSDLGKINIGAWMDGSYKLNGHIKSLIYYPKALDDDILQLKTKQSIL